MAVKGSTVSGGTSNGTSNRSTKKTSYAGSIVPGISTALATGDGMGPDEGTTRESCWPLDRPAIMSQALGDELDPGVESHTSSTHAEHLDP